MYLTVATYMADGVQREFAVPFTYIKKDYVKAYSEELDTKGRVVGERQPLSFSWLNDGWVRMDTIVPVGHRLTIERETYADKPLVDFQDAAIVTEQDLDLATLQSLHVAQEARDRNGYEILEASYNVMLAVDEVKEYAERVEDAAADSESNLQECEEFAASAGRARDAALEAKREAIEFCDKATAEAGELLELAQNSTEQITRDVEAFNQKVEEGTQRLAEAKELVDEVFSNATEMAEQVEYHATDAYLSAQKAHADMLSARADAIQAETARDRAVAAKDVAVTMRDAALQSEVKAKEWADNPPWQEVEPGKYSARHHADRAAATGDLAGHVAAEDPHPQYIRREETNGDFFRFDEFGDITMCEEIKEDAYHPMFHLDAWGDMALNA
ncbi:MAG: hypothetical protein LUG50_06835 [Planctomycetaceae bacterium]|nr:hypothetical protein [Planctomycetaceae bacterium]